MSKKIIINLVLLCVLLCSCAAAGSNTAAASPTRAAITLSVPTPTMSTPTKTTPLSAPENTPAPFSVTGVDISVSPATLATWTCGAYIQVVYHVVFHVVSGPGGGIISFDTTVNNGRSETPEKLTILPGQHMTDYVFTWQGPLPADHTYPGPGGIMVSSPNQLTSQMVSPTGACR